MGCGSSANVPRTQGASEWDAQPADEEVSFVPRQASRRFDPDMGYSMTFPEMCIAFSQAQMSESQMLERWDKMQSLKALEVVADRRPGKTLLERLALNSQAQLIGPSSTAEVPSNIKLNVRSATGESCFDGEVPGNWSLAELKERIVPKCQSGLWRDVQFQMNGELLPDMHRVSSLPYGSALCLV